MNGCRGVREGEGGLGEERARGDDEGVVHAGLFEKVGCAANTSAEFNSQWRVECGRRQPDSLEGSRRTCRDAPPE